MSINFLIFGLGTVLFFALQAGCADSSSRNLVAHSETVTANKVEQQNSYKGQVKLRTNGEQPISKEEAIAIAKEEAAKTYQSLDSFNVVACEQRTLWLVILDGGGPEYYIGKDTGKVLLVERLPQGDDDASVGDSKEVSQEEAIATAKKDFLASDGEGVNLFDPVACELSKTWRVFFEYRMQPGETLATMPNADPPSYVISKTTGKVLHKRCCS